MPLDLAKVGLAVQGGLSAVCATCTRYWEGRDQRLPEPKCTAKEDCASPLGGGDFHEYVGPLTDFEQWCFRCGSASDYVVVLAARDRRRMGVCRNHVSMFNELQPLTGDAARVFLRGMGSFVRPEDLLPRRRKSLIAAILEVESYYANKEGREL